MYLNISGVFCGSGAGSNHAAPGECYYYQNFDRYKIGIRLHLYTILRESPSKMPPKLDMLTETSGRPPCDLAIHSSNPTKGPTLPPYQWLHRRLASIDRQRRSDNDRARSLWRHIGDTILDRSNLHLDYDRSWTRNLQRQETPNRPTPSLDVKNMVLRMSQSTLLHAAILSNLQT